MHWFAHPPPQVSHHSPCNVRCAHEHPMQQDSPVTCAPVGGQHTAQCTAVHPPLRGRQKESGAGGIPRPSTPSCAADGAPDTLGTRSRCHSDGHDSRPQKEHGGGSPPCSFQGPRLRYAPPPPWFVPRQREKGGQSLSPICRLSLRLGSYCGCTYS